MNKRAMAIVALALCACMLAPCAQAQADPTLVEAGRFSAYAEFAETAALVIDEDAQTGLEGVFDHSGRGAGAGGVWRDRAGRRGGQTSLSCKTRAA